MIRNKLPKKLQIVELLSDGEWHDGSQLNAIAHRFGNLIFVLRKDGCTIEKKQITKAHWKYRMTGIPEHRAVSAYDMTLIKESGDCPKWL